MSAKRPTQLDLSRDVARPTRRARSDAPLSTRKRVLLIDYQSWLALTDGIAKAAASGATRRSTLSHPAGARPS